MESWLPVICTPSGTERYIHFRMLVHFVPVIKLSVVHMFYLRKMTESWLPPAYQIDNVRCSGKDIGRRTAYYGLVHHVQVGYGWLPKFGVLSLS
jgi:hypothetical protein